MLISAYYTLTSFLHDHCKNHEKNSEKKKRFRKKVAYSWSCS